MDWVYCLDEESKECVENFKHEEMNLSQAVSLRRFKWILLLWKRQGTCCNGGYFEDWDRRGVARCTVLLGDKLGGMELDVVVVGIMCSCFLLGLQVIPCGQLLLWIYLPGWHLAENIIRWQWTWWGNWHKSTIYCHCCDYYFITFSFYLSHSSSSTTEDKRYFYCFASMMDLITLGAELSICCKADCWF